MIDGTGRLTVDDVLDIERTIFDRRRKLESTELISEHQARLLREYPGCCELVMVVWEEITGLTSFVDNKFVDDNDLPPWPFDEEACDGTEASA